MLALLSTFALASCEDVPMPYPNPDVDGGSDEITEEILPEGDGTFENPYNVAAVVELCNNLGSDAESAQAVYVKGKVASNTTTEATISQYGNMTFTMIDEGNTKTTFTAFQVYGPEKKKFTSVDQIKEGDEVIVSELEHHSNIVSWQLQQARKGIKLRVIPINDDGEIILEEYEKLFNEKTRIVSSAHVSHVMGTVNP